MLSLRKDVALSLTMLAFVPVILAIVIFIGKKIDGIWEVSDKFVDRQNEIMRERLRGIRVIRAFNSEKREHERVSEATRIMASSFIRGNVAMGAISPLATFLLNVAAVLIVYLGGWRMETSTGLTGGDILPSSSMCLWSLRALSPVRLPLSAFPRPKWRQSASGRCFMPRAWPTPSSGRTSHCPGISTLTM